SDPTPRQRRRGRPHGDAARAALRRAVDVHGRPDRPRRGGDRSRHHAAARDRRPRDGAARDSRRRGRGAPRALRAGPPGRAARQQAGAGGGGGGWGGVGLGGFWDPPPMMTVLERSPEEAMAFTEEYFAGKRAVAATQSPATADAVAGRHDDDANSRLNEVLF